MENKLNFRNMASEKNLDDEINLGNFFSFLLRNIRFIGKLTFFTFIIACLYSFTLKKVWEGQFQIVLNMEDKNSQISSNSALTTLLNSQKSSNTLATQVGILESPSLLMPIYELVHENNQKDFKSQKSFSKWKKNLNIKLKKGTSILDIAYRDKDKEKILPVLKKMSSTYQDYSGKSLKTSQELAEKYLTEQIKLFREKSSKSFKIAQNFAIDQNLTYEVPNNQGLNQNLVNQNTLNEAEQFLTKSILNVETLRAASANKIKTINLQIEKINELDPMDYEGLQYFGSSIPALSQEGLPDTLKKIEEKLVVLRTQFTENDLSIRALLEQRKLTVDLLKSRALKYLKVAKLEAEALMESSMRPKGILLKYKELMREASRDEATLVSLENSLQRIQLLLAQRSTPWELITKPTLLTDPVAPSKKIVGLYGIALGLILSLMISFYREKKSGKIFSLLELENILSYAPLEKINKDVSFTKSKEIKFLKEFLKNQNAKKIVFITLEEINKSYMKNLRDYLNNKTNLGIEVSLILSQNELDKCNNGDFTILFTSLSEASISEITTLRNRLNFLEIDLKEFVLLE